MSHSATSDVDLPDVPAVEGFPILPPNIVYALIGRGASGRVFLAVDGKTGEDVAVKCLSLADDRLNQRFDKEARVGASIDHPSFVKVRGSGRERRSGMRYFSMDFVAGESARERVERTGPMSVAMALTVVREAVRGIAALHHKGMIHRDIKPDNLLISGGGELRIADLGLIKETHMLSEITMTGDTLGTPSFMAPEQAGNAREAGPESDVFGLGATLLYLLVGHPPMRRGGRIELPNVPALAKIPTSLLEWLQRTLDPDPTRRFPDAATAGEALDPIVTEAGSVSLADRLVDMQVSNWYRLRPSPALIRRIQQDVDLEPLPLDGVDDGAGLSRVTLAILAVIAVILGIAVGRWTQGAH